MLDVRWRLKSAGLVDALAAGLRSRRCDSVRASLLAGRNVVSRGRSRRWDRTRGAREAGTDTPTIVTPTTRLVSAALVVLLLGALVLPVAEAWRPAPAYALGIDPAKAAQAIADAVSIPQVMTFGEACMAAGCSLKEGFIINALGTAGGYYDIIGRSAAVGWRGFQSLALGMMGNPTMAVAIHGAALTGLTVGNLYIWCYQIPKELYWAGRHDLGSGQAFMSEVPPAAIEAMHEGWGEKAQSFNLMVAGDLLIDAGRTGSVGSVVVSGTVVTDLGDVFCTFRDVSVGGVRLGSTDFTWLLNVMYRGESNAYVDGYWAAGTLVEREAWASAIILGSTAEGYSLTGQDSATISDSEWPNVIAVPGTVDGSETTSGSPDGSSLYPDEGLPAVSAPPERAAGSAGPFVIPDGGLATALNAAADGLEIPADTPEGFRQVLAFLVLPLQMMLRGLAVVVTFATTAVQQVVDMISVELVPNAPGLAARMGPAIDGLGAVAATRWPFAIGPWAGSIPAAFGSGPLANLGFDFMAWRNPDVPVRVRVNEWGAWAEPYRPFGVALVFLGLVFGLVSLFRPRVTV